MEKAKEKPIYLIRRHILAKSVLYQLIVQNQSLYFCELGHAFWVSEKQKRRYHAGMTDGELLGARGNFRLDAPSLSDIRLETKRSPWTAAVDNHGWLRFLSGQKEMRFIVCGQTPVDALKDALGKAGLTDIAVLDNAEPEAPAKPADPKEDLKQAKRVSRCSRALNWLTGILAVWMLLYPVAFSAGAVLSLLLPAAGLLLYGKYRRFFRSKSRRSEKIRPMLSVPILLPPLILSAAVILNLNVLYTPGFFAVLLALTAVCVAILLWKLPNFRSKSWAGLLALFLFCFLYSGTLITNCLTSRPTDRYTAVVENKQTRFSGKATIHRLELSPWGAHPSQNTVTVGTPIYYSVNEGDTLSITRERGLWGIEWYRLTPMKQDGGQRLW